MTLPQLRIALKGVSAYLNITDSREMGLFTSLLDAVHMGDGEGAVTCYTRLFHTLREGRWDSLGDWMLDRLRYEESPYPILIAEGRTDPALTGAAHRDVELFAEAAGVDCEQLIEAIAPLLKGSDYAALLAGLPRWPARVPFDFDSLTEFYVKHGAGIYARYRAFLWQGGRLLPVADPDCPSPDEMIGYELQRGQVIANTKSMLEGNLVNNVLLYGNTGTGKSATVKSLLAIPGFEDLRLVEVAKEELGSMPALIRILEGKRHKFILFIDDLAFDQDDRTYSVLKTILEGGLERRPANVAIYATSNRRHLVRQTFSDRAGDEVDASETVEEKTSLADRFGLRVPYLSLSKAEYLDMVDRLAQQYGVSMEKETLYQKAMQWELRHHGRTPRTARQFISSLF